MRNKMECGFGQVGKWLAAQVARWSAGAMVFGAAAACWAQEVGRLDDVAAAEPRGFTPQYVLVFVLSALAVAAACKPSFRHSKDDE